MGDQDRPDEPPPRRSVSQRTWDMIMLLVASLIATIAGLVAGGWIWIYDETDRPVSAVIAACVVFGGVLDRALRIIKMLDRPPGGPPR